MSSSKLKFNQTEEFKKLNEKWKKKLEKSGFQDIEENEDRLKSWASHYFNSRYEKEIFDSKYEYFRMAGQFLYEKKFSSNREYLIWEMHAQGHTITAISNELKLRRFKMFNRTNVHAVIQKLTKEMFIKYGKKDSGPKRPDSDS